MSKVIGRNILNHKKWCVLCVLLFFTLFPDCVGNTFSDNKYVRLGNGIYHTVAVSPDGENLAIGTSLGFGLYHANTLQEIWFKFQECSIQSFSFSPKGTELAVAIKHTIVLFESGSGKEIHTLTALTDAANIVLIQTELEKSLL